MSTRTPAAKTVDEYIKRYPSRIQPVLQSLRKTIKKTAPDAEEVISYAIPGYKYHGMLIFFAAFKDHISVYPAPRGNDAFKKELSGYKGGKGTVQFPVGEPVPFDLVTRIVKFRMQENEAKAGAKKKAAIKPGARTAGSARTADEQQVSAFMKTLDHPMKAETEALRKILKNSNNKLSERIKWNAPSYYYKQDIVTFGPFRTGKVFLVFRHPEIVNVKSGLLEGNYTNRRLAYFDNMKAVKENKKELERILNALVKAIDKR